MKLEHINSWASNPVNVTVVHLAIATVAHAQQEKRSVCGRGFSRRERNSSGKDIREKTKK